MSGSSSTIRSSTPTATSSRSARCSTTRCSPTSRRSAAPRCATGTCAAASAPTDTSTILAEPPTTRRCASSGGRCRRGGAGRPSNVRDRATAHLPALLYERLDELGIDFTILYPSMSLGVPRVADAELVGVRVPRGEPVPRRVCSRRTATAARSARWSRCTRPSRRSPSCEYAVRELGLKTRADRRARQAPARRTAAPCTGSTRSGIDSDVRLRPVLGQVRRARRRAGVAQRAAVRTASRARSRATSTTTSAGSAAAHESLCKSLFLGGVTRRFPTLRFGFLEGGVAWACSLLRRPRRALGEAQRATRSATSTPTARRRRADGATSTQYGDDDGDRAASTSSATYFARPARGPRSSTSSPRARSSSPTTSVALFVPNFYFGCEADDPLVAWAFRERRQPARRAAAPDLRLRHLALGRARHDRAGRRGLRARRARRDRRARLPRARRSSTRCGCTPAPNPDFFAGTVCEPRPRCRRRRSRSDGRDGP